MSIENVKRFYETIVADSDLRNKMIEINRKYEGRSLTDKELEMLMVEEFLPLLKQEGFDFSMDELSEYQEQLYENELMPLETSSLESVSGGRSYSLAAINFINSLYVVDED